jgi:hypothetical protein
MFSDDYNLLTKQKDLISLAPILLFNKKLDPFLDAQERLINDTDKSKDRRRCSQ